MGVVPLFQLCVLQGQPFALLKHSLQVTLPLVQKMAIKPKLMPLIFPDTQEV